MNSAQYREDIEKHFGADFSRIQSTPKRNKALIRSFGRDDSKLSEFISLIIKLPGEKCENLMKYGISVRRLRNGLNKNYKEFERFFNNHMPDRSFIGPDKLKDLGFSVAEMEKLGFPLYKIRKHKDITLRDFKKAGYTLQQLVDKQIIKNIDERVVFEGEYSRSEIINFVGENYLKLLIDNEGEDSYSHNEEWKVPAFVEAGFTGKELREVGYSALDLRNHANFSVDQLREAGYSTHDIRYAVEYQKSSSEKTGERNRARNDSEYRRSSIREIRKRERENSIEVIERRRKSFQRSKKFIESNFTATN